MSIDNTIIPHQIVDSRIQKIPIDQHNHPTPDVQKIPIDQHHLTPDVQKIPIEQYHHPTLDVQKIPMELHHHPIPDVRKKPTRTPSLHMYSKDNYIVPNLELYVMDTTGSYADVWYIHSPCS